MCGGGANRPPHYPQCDGRGSVPPPLPMPPQRLESSKDKRTSARAQRRRTGTSAVKCLKSSRSDAPCAAHSINHHKPTRRRPYTQPLKLAAIQTMQPAIGSDATTERNLPFPSRRCYRGGGILHLTNQQHVHSNLHRTQTTKMLP